MAQNIQKNFGALSRVKNLYIVCFSFKQNPRTTSLIKVRKENVTEAGGNILLPGLNEDVNYEMNIIYMVDGCGYVSSKVFSGKCYFLHQPKNLLNKLIIFMLSL